MTKSKLELLLSDADVDLAHVRWDYSGRGMYGRTCWGFVGSHRDLASFFSVLGIAVGEARGDDYFADDDDDDDELEDALVRLGATLTVDNMGHDLIFYFPGFKIDDN